MPDIPYSKREQDERWSDVANSLSRIEIQTTLTNGKVGDINRWRERINGGAVVAGVFMTLIVMPILAWAIFVLVNINTTIHHSIDEALSAYNIKETVDAQ